MISNSVNDKMFFVALTISFMFLSTSCSDNDDQFIVNGQDLIGEWMFVSENIRGNPLEANECKQQRTINFLNETDYVSLAPSPLPEAPSTPPCDLIRTDAIYQLDGNVMSFFGFNDTNLPPNSKAEIEQLNESTLVITFVELEGIVIDAPTVIWARVN